MERTTRQNVQVPQELAESGTVTVALKLPNGLFLRVFRQEEVAEPVMGGGSRVTKRAVQTGETICLNGTAFPFGTLPEYKIIGGYALTEDVDAQFFAEWMRQNADSEIVKNKLIYGYVRADRVAAQAKEQRDIRSGLEPMKQDGDARMPKDIRLGDRKAAA